MKLSEKGKRKILDNPCWFSEEFEPSDFKGCVVLTAEEVEGAFAAVREGIMMCESAGRYSYGLVFLKDLLSKRIEPAEEQK